MRRPFRVLIVPLLLCGFLAGCGGNDLLATAKDVPAEPPVPPGSQMKELTEMLKQNKGKRPMAKRPSGPPRPPGT